MTSIKITWKASFHPATGFTGEDTQASLVYNFGNLSDTQICDAIYQQTNLYSGDAWELIKLVLPEARTHTALSLMSGPKVDGEFTDIGDLVSVDGRTYSITTNGWKGEEA